jgi:hypothetical protein
MIYRCAMCDYEFKRRDLRCCSGLYGSAGIQLCKFCYEDERELIDRRGTNDIPEVLASYRKDVR